jgi:hypothetical protein
MLFNILKVLAIVGMIISAVLIATAFLPKLYTEALDKMLGHILIAIGALEAIMGLAAVGMGRTIEGGIFTAMGATTAICGYIATVDANESGAKLDADQKLEMAIVSSLSAACQTGTLIAGAVQ